MNLEDFTRMVVRKIEETNANVVLQTPTNQAIFPLKVVRMPLESIIKTENGLPIKTRYSISVEEWADKKYTCMQMSQDTANKLIQLNILKTGNDIDIYDDITKMYRLITRYEVIYNGLYNSLELVK